MRASILTVVSLGGETTIWKKNSLQFTYITIQNFIQKTLPICLDRWLLANTSCFFLYALWHPCLYVSKVICRVNEDCAASIIFDQNLSSFKSRDPGGLPSLPAVSSSSILSVTNAERLNKAFSRSGSWKERTMNRKWNTDKDQRRIPSQTYIRLSHRYP